jgi:hypothetical protein
MRVISLVPSWTETLIECGFIVCGRTRYCIHPAGSVDRIPIVGGTKDYRWDQINAMNVDFVLVDKEENRQSIVEKCRHPLHITHVEAVADMPKELDRLQKRVKVHNGSSQTVGRLADLGERWKQQLSRRHGLQPQSLPGVMQWIRCPQQEVQRVVYIIWKEPVMAVSRNTFIGSMLDQLGLGVLMPEWGEKYPVISLDRFLDQNTLLLFSSEPYDFSCTEEIQWIESLQTPAALVDGESFSWFGLRSLRFLESVGDKN